MMVIKRGMNKKGAGNEGWTLTEYILALAVLFFIGFAIYSFYSSSSQAVATVTPEELAALKVRCLGSSQSVDPISVGTFCAFTSQKFGGKEGVANCQQKDVLEALKKDANYGQQANDLSVQCGEERDKALEYCNDLKSASQFNTIIVNGFTCKTWGAPGKMCKDIKNPDGTSAGWVVDITQCAKGSDVTNQVINTEDRVSNKVCCLSAATGVKTGSTTNTVGTKTNTQECNVAASPSECADNLVCRNDPSTNVNRCLSAIGA